MDGNSSSQRTDNQKKMGFALLGTHHYIIFVEYNNYFEYNFLLLYSVILCRLFFSFYLGGFIFSL